LLTKTDRRTPCQQLRAVERRPTPTSVRRMPAGPLASPRRGTLDHCSERAEPEGHGSAPLREARTSITAIQTLSAPAVAQSRAGRHRSRATCDCQVAYVSRVVVDVTKAARWRSLRGERLFRGAASSRGERSSVARTVCWRWSTAWDGSWSGQGRHHRNTPARRVRTPVAAPTKRVVASAITVPRPGGGLLRRPAWSSRRRTAAAPARLQVRDPARRPW